MRLNGKRETLRLVTLVTFQDAKENMELKPFSAYRIREIL